MRRIIEELKKWDSGESSSLFSSQITALLKNGQSILLIRISPKISYHESWMCWRLAREGNKYIQKKVYSQQVTSKKKSDLGIDFTAKRSSKTNAS